MVLGQLFEIFIKLPMFDCSRAACILIRGQNELWSHVGEGKPQKSEIFHKNPFYGCIESIKSVGKDLEKLHWKVAQGFFLKILFLVEFWFHYI